MKLKYLLIVLLGITFSCADDLLEEPKSFIDPDVYFNTEAEVESAIYGAYSFMHNRDIADDQMIRSGGSGTDIGSGRVHQMRDGQLDTFEPDNEVWRVIYEAIGATNTIVSRIESSEKFSTEFKERIVGEAKFLRAYYYYRLNMYWGNVPIWLGKLNIEEVEQLRNSSSADVRQQIITDLIDASNKLPSTVSQEGRATKWMAKGLLARVYLFNNNYQGAKDLSSDVINNSPHALIDNLKELYDYRNPFNSEMIHVVPKLANVKGSRIQTHVSPQTKSDGKAIAKILEANPGLKIIRPLDSLLVTDVESRSPGGIFQGWGSLQVLKEHYDSFQPGDLRKDLIWHYIDFTDGTRFEMTGGGSCGSALKGRSGYYPLKWAAFDSSPNDGSRSVYLQRLGELYLILAEAENELNGPTGVAYNAINRIRERAFGDNTHALSGLSKDQFRKAVQDENRWELASEGVRKYYLWHWGFEVMKAAVNSVAGSLPLLAANTKPHHQWWRIPAVELAKNPNLTQNPGY
jgi:hypothetical protein